MQKLLLVCYNSEKRATSQIWKVLPNMVFSPDLGGGGGEWRRSEHAHASYPGLFFRPPGFSPYMGREESRVQGLDYARLRTDTIDTDIKSFIFIHLYSASLTRLFSLSLETRIFPSLWKFGKVKALFKKGDRCDANN